LNRGGCSVKFFGALKNELLKTPDQLISVKNRKHPVDEAAVILKRESSV